MLGPEAWKCLTFWVNPRAPGSPSPSLGWHPPRPLDSTAPPQKPTPTRPLCPWGLSYSRSHPQASVPVRPRHRVAGFGQPPRAGSVVGRLGKARRVGGQASLDCRVQALQGPGPAKSAAVRVMGDFATGERGASRSSGCRPHGASLPGLPVTPPPQLPGVLWLHPAPLSAPQGPGTERSASATWGEGSRVTSQGSGQPCTLLLLGSLVRLRGPGAPWWPLGGTTVSWSRAFRVESWGPVGAWGSCGGGRLSWLVGWRLRVSQDWRGGRTALGLWATFPASTSPGGRNSVGSGKRGRQSTRGFCL